MSKPSQIMIQLPSVIR